MTWRKQWMSDICQQMSTVPCCSQSHRCYLACQYLYIFFGVIHFFFFCARMQWLIIKNFCLLVTPHLTSFISAMILGSHKHTLHFIDRKTGSEWPSIAQGHGENNPCLSVSKAVLFPFYPWLKTSVALNRPQCATPGEHLPCSHPSEPIRATQIRNVRLKQINREAEWAKVQKWDLKKWRHQAPRSRIPTGPFACNSLRLSHWHLKCLLLNKMCILLSFSASSLWSSNQLCCSFFRKPVRMCQGDCNRELKMFLSCKI